MNADEFFKEMVGKFKADKAEGLDFVIQFKLTGDEGGDYYLTVKDKTATYAKGTVDSPRLTISAATSDFIDIFTGKMDGAQAFMQGKLKILGDMGIAMKMQQIFF